MSRREFEPRTLSTTVRHIRYPTTPSTLKIRQIALYSQVNDDSYEAPAPARYHSAFHQGYRLLQVPFLSKLDARCYLFVLPRTPFHLIKVLPNIVVCSFVQ